MTSRSSVAPGTMLIRPSNSASLPTLLSRHTATTSYPRSSACRTMYLPSFPDAPTTQILMTRLDSSQFRAIEPARATSSRNPPSEATWALLAAYMEVNRAQVGFGDRSRRHCRFRVISTVRRLLLTAMMCQAMTIDSIERPAHAHLRGPVLWGLVFGAAQAASPLAFWWLDTATVYA